jgi:hypothetical protein
MASRNFGNVKAAAVKRHPSSNVTVTKLRIAQRPDRVILFCVPIEIGDSHLKDGT